MLAVFDTLQKNILKKEVANSKAWLLLQDFRNFCFCRCGGAQLAVCCCQPRSHPVARCRDAPESLYRLDVIAQRVVCDAQNYTIPARHKGIETNSFLHRL